MLTDENNTQSKPEDEESIKAYSACLHALIVYHVISIIKKMKGFLLLFLKGA